MEINPEIKSILKSCKIHIDYGILYLLAVYYNLDAKGAIPEEIFRKVNLSKIFDKDYNTKTIVWNIPLFVGQEAGAFAWVNEWMHPFGAIGTPARRGTVKEVTTRMKEWFSKNPEYRKEDVFAARDLYFTTEKPSGGMVKTSHKFIYEGTGAMQVSLLLFWCERLKTISGTEGKTNPLMKGKIM
jgi:hypothetical protein